MRAAFTSGHVLPRPMPCEEVAGQQLDDLAPRADHDLGLERQPARDLSAQARPADLSADQERPGRADVHGIEMREPPGEHRRLEPTVPTNVDAP